jgi:Zn-dependent protease
MFLRIFDVLKCGNRSPPPAFILLLPTLLLAVFNMFTGYPLDRDRVLRAYIGNRGSDLPEAAVMAGKFGKIIAA